jgi:hypothetical protein
MPLNRDAEMLIRGNIAVIKRGKKPRPVIIGCLTDGQLKQINDFRRHHGFPEIVKEILFVGTHLYKSRVEGDGYTVEEILSQIESALSTESRLIPSLKMTVIENPNLRCDGTSSRVKDQAVLECTGRHPHPELYSVIPKGDDNTRKQKSRPKAALQEPTNSPG